MTRWSFSTYLAIVSRNWLQSIFVLIFSKFFTYANGMFFLVLSKNYCKIWETLWQLDFLPYDLLGTCQIWFGCFSHYLDWIFLLFIAGIDKKFLVWLLGIHLHSGRKVWIMSYYKVNPFNINKIIFLKLSCVN